MEGEVSDYVAADDTVEEGDEENEEEDEEEEDELDLEYDYEFADGDDVDVYAFRTNHQRMGRYIHAECVMGCNLP